MPRLDNWSVVGTFDPYQAPEQQVKKLHGQVSDHPMFPDGVMITTSAIAAIEADTVVTHSGSRYELGIVDPGYEAAYPNARERLFSKGL